MTWADTARRRLAAAGATLLVLLAAVLARPGDPRLPVAPALSAALRDGLLDSDL